MDGSSLSERQAAGQLTTAKDPNLIFDVGLHRGEDTDFYLKKGFRVVAFEANPDLVALCRKRFDTFIDQGFLTIVEGAIVDSAQVEPGQTVRFYRNDVAAWGTVQAEWADRNRRSGAPSTVVEVNTVDFVGAIKKYGVPHYMKVDIEGCDSICLASLASFRDRPDFVSLESSKTSFDDIRREITLLRSLGYQSFRAVEQSDVESQSPPNPAREGRLCEHQFEDGASGLFGRELEGRWMSEAEILRLYRYIRLGYFLLGDDGILNVQFRGASRLRASVRTVLRRFTHASVPGWYDTHAALRLPDTSRA